MGIFYALTGLSTLVASLLAGVIWDRVGPQAALIVGAGFAILALMALGLVRRKIQLNDESASGDIEQRQVDRQN